MTVKHSKLLFLGTSEDRSHLPRLKPLMGGVTTFVDTRPVSTVAEVELYCKHVTRNITGVLSTSVELLSKFTGKSNPSLDSYAGSYFYRNGIEYVFCNPLEHVHTVPYGEFLLERHASKLVAPEKWLEPSEFWWRICDSSTKLIEAYNWLAQCRYIAVDIETFKDPLSIRCIGYTGYLSGAGLKPMTRSYVLPLNNMQAVHAIRIINDLPGSKILQNGKYDIAYLLAYNAPLRNYFWDTAALFHSLYSELPKDLAFLQAFFVRTAAYWKDLADTQDLEQYYLYNAKDTWATLHVMLAWINEAPPWAVKNYMLEFPVQYPCILSEATGLQRDTLRVDSARSEIDKMVDKRSASLNTCLSTTNFNVNSPIQMKSLLGILGCKDLPGAGDKELAKAAYRHPLNSRIIDYVRGVPKTDVLEDMGIRSLRKVKSTYLRTDSDITKKDGSDGDKDFKGRILYTLNPHGTDTGRLASKSHHFWAGFNVQNIPVGKVVKDTIVADDGFLFGEVDLEQAEARDVAHIAGDTSLITAVSGSRDFHSVNAAAFFGVSYESIYDDVAKKTLNKKLRNLAKRVNHGANYNMGPDVLVDTMGEKAIYEAGILLGLPRHWTAREIAVYLLAQFDKTYPVIRGKYHKYLIEQISVHKKLVGATGWTRYCFSKPQSSKPALNAYVAHPSQSLNAMVLNQAYMKVFNDLALSPTHANPRLYTVPI
jgi:hypothetical protein